MSRSVSSLISRRAVSSLGFAWLNMTFGETGKTVLLMDDEDFMIMNDDGAARGFGFGIRGCGGGGIGLAEVGVSEVGLLVLDWLRL